MTHDLYQSIGTELNLGILQATEGIQSLWSGYGELVRLVFTNSSVIVKHVKLPQKSEHPRGWNTNLSHQRKVNSYKIETNWYEHFSEVVDERCRIPQSLKTYKGENEWLIVMEDLSQLGLTQTTLDGTKNHLKSCLTWLANFHAKYMNTKSDLLWEVGTYWHLDTRPDELEVLKKSELKSYAKHIDEVLKSSKYQTIVHGDAKIANFCFNEDATKCAAVDFQYVGYGCGMKDVAYFMSSAIEPENCGAIQDWVLKTYFKALKEALNHYQPHLDFAEVEKEWQVLFPIAWADFHRFIKGWSPTHYKINDYSENITAQALAYLKENHV